MRISQIIEKKRNIIFDLDGTLADVRHRRYLTKEHWPSFERSCITDAPMEPIADMLRMFYAVGFTIWIVSARSSTVRGYTEDWLEDNNIPYDNLIMRDKYDSRDDAVVKREWLETGRLPPKDEIAFVVDDRNKVVDMWRAAGLTCLQSAPGDF